jgi:hypothetical protein
MTSSLLVCELPCVFVVAEAGEQGAELVLLDRGQHWRRVEHGLNRRE